MPRVATRESDLTPTEVFDLYLDRCAQIAKHPLIVEHGDAEGHPFKFGFIDSDYPTASFGTFDEAQWMQLALYVRPIMYLPSEPIYINKVLNLIGRVAPTLRESAKFQRKSLEDWRRGVYFGIRSGIEPLDVDPQFELDPDGPPRLIETKVYPVGSAIPDDPEYGPTVTDKQLAETYFNSALFHIDGDGSRAFAKTQGLERKAYEIAAQMRTVYCWPHVDQVRGLIEYGRQTGQLSL